MEKNTALLISSFFVLITEQSDIAESVIRGTVAKHSLTITPEDIAEIRAAWYLSPEWLPAELEVYRILGI